MKTTAFNRSGRQVPVFIPTNDSDFVLIGKTPAFNPSLHQSEIVWYVEKFLMKMNGCEEHVARAWVEGINYNSEMTEAIWSAIVAHPETEFFIYNPLKN